MQHWKMAIKRVNCILSPSNWVCRTLALDIDPNPAKVVHRHTHIQLQNEWTTRWMNRTTWGKVHGGDLFSPLALRIEPRSIYKVWFLFFRILFANFCELVSECASSTMRMQQIDYYLLPIGPCSLHLWFSRLHSYPSSLIHLIAAQALD